MGRAGRVRRLRKSRWIAARGMEPVVLQEGGSIRSIARVGERKREEGTTDLIELGMPDRLPDRAEVATEHKGRKSDEEEPEDEKRHGDQSTECGPRSDLSVSDLSKLESA